MKRHWMRLAIVLVPACMVDTPVVEGPDERQGENLDEWCDSVCAKITECGMNEEPDCTASCVEYFEESFIGKGEMCEASASRVMDCFDEASCTELAVDEVCNVDAEAARCAAMQGLVTCDVTGGSSGGTAGTAGSTTAPRCSFDYGECSDGSLYEVACEGSDPRECTCSVDGVVRGRYGPLSATCPEGFEAKRICGWPIRHPLDEPSTPPVVCEIMDGSGSGGGECDIFMDDCSDGHYYGALCSGPAGDVTCTCTIDGYPVASPRAPIEICQYALENDNGVAALNYACNFSLSSVIPK